MLAGLAFSNFAIASIHHRLNVEFHVPAGEIRVTDEVQLDGPAIFSLGEDFELSALNGRLTRLRQVAPGIRNYRIEPDSDRPVTLVYKGNIGGEGEDIFGMPSAVIDEQGIFLDASSAWYPLFRQPSVTYSMNISLPKGWSLVPQGRLTTEVPGKFLVEAKEPQEDIYIVAGPFEVYSRNVEGRPLSVFLLQPDEALANRYLDVMGDYIAFYEALIGPYPHEGFSVVENRWQTGYGMPGFTLLGSRVLRLPFLLKSSVPHEILHNWFGNGIYVDAREGNWSEGLTAYLADYLIKETDGQGASHRQRSLARYTDFASEGRDMPVSEFRSRHDDRSQSVGYDKVQMLMHMLRRQLGDQAFVAGLQKFYSEQEFQRADFTDLLASFEADGWDPAAFYETWMTRPGAPELAVTQYGVTESEGQFRLEFTLSQTQGGKPFPLQVPVYVSLQGEEEPQRTLLYMNTRNLEVTLDFTSRPLRLDVDPSFDLFRQLSGLERPSALGRLFGAKRQWLVLPSAAPEADQKAWRELAAVWERRYKNVKLVEDTESPKWGDEDAVWLLGWNNAFLDRYRDRFEGPDQRLDTDGVSVNAKTYDRVEFAAVLLDPDNSRKPLGFVGVDDVTGIRRMASKLTHYGSYGRLIFDVPGLNNRVRDRLAVIASPLSVSLTEQQVPLNLGEEPRLADIVDAPLPD